MQFVSLGWQNQMGVVRGGLSPAQTPAIELVYNGNLLTYDGKTLVYGVA